MHAKLLKWLPEEEKDQFFKELEEAVDELVLSGDIHAFCEFLEDWKEMAYLHKHPKLLE